MPAQSPTDQAQDQVEQDQAQGLSSPESGSDCSPALSSDPSSCWLKFQFRVPAQIGQNIPVQPLPQPVPMQLAPAGIVVPAPQIIYQNWIGKKPEFSGKPEEDAESHLLSTRDWMEAHNFPEGEKVRHFCITANR